MISFIRNMSNYKYMITKIGIKRFKGINSLNSLELKPITVLCGRNSSGKTSILESLLLLKQSSEKHLSLDRLDQNGKYVRLGTFKDILFKSSDETLQSTEKSLVFSFTIDRKTRWRIADKRQEKASEKTSNIDLVFQNKKEDNSLFDNIVLEKIILRNTENKAIDEISLTKLDQNQTLLTWNLKSRINSSIIKDIGEIRYDEVNISSFFANTNISETEDTIILTRVSVPHVDSSQYSSVLNEEFQPLLDLRNHLNYIQKDGDSIKDSIDRNLLIKVKELFEIQKEDVIKSVKGNYRNLISLNDEILKDKDKNADILTEQIKDLLKYIERILNEEIIGFRLNISEELRNLISELKKFHFIGPLREEPSLRYICEDQKLEIGIRGENAPLIYESEKEGEIQEFSIYEDHDFKIIKNKKMNEILNIWSDYFKFGEISRKKESDSMFSLFINNHKLKHVGFGISQVLPILLEGIRMDKHDTLILEQPEIHLHPDLQMRLADLFIGMGLSKRNSIIETHSEHIVNRIVRRIVEDSEDKIGKLIGIYFVKMDKDGLILEEINIGKEGIKNWPKDFFDEAMKEQSAILRQIRRNETQSE